MGRGRHAHLPQTTEASVILQVGSLVTGDVEFVGPSYAFVDVPGAGKALFHKQQFRWYLHLFIQAVHVVFTYS